MTRRMLIVGLLAALGLSAPSTARAGLIPTVVSVTPQAGDFRWTYAIVLPTDSQLRAGDYFTVYDFAGLVPGSNVQPEGWTLSVANLGTTPDLLIPEDSAAVPNLTWTYTGDTINTGQTGLGNFWAASSFGGSAEGAFTGRTHRTSDGGVDSNITDTTVPVPVPPASGVPEPTTLALSALGLPLAALLRRRSARAAAAV